MKSKCLVCSEQDAKYKCPTCYLPFCSVTCGKNHKITPCKRPEPAPEPPNSNHSLSNKSRKANNKESQTEEEILSSDQLTGLDENNEVQRKIRDDRLMLILERIDKAPNRANALEREMRNPEFLEFCDDVLEALDMKEVTQAT